MWARIADDIATHYGPDSLGIESHYIQDFVHLSRVALPSSYSMGTGVFPALKRPGHSDNQSTDSTR